MTDTPKPQRRFWTRLGVIFAPRVTITRTMNGGPVTDQQRKAFDEAFAHMNRAFDAINKVFKP